MAITPRTILTSPAPATVAVISLFFFTALGMMALSSQSGWDCQLRYAQAPPSPCGQMAQNMGAKSTWSEFSWVQYSYCYDEKGNSEGAIGAAAEGLQYYPASQMLYNLKGYHEIVLGQHSQAIDTLRTGMANVGHQSNGIMANNLAWAGLWEPRQMRLEEARELYLQSLARSPNVCETLHTGLFVEFAISSRSQGMQRYEDLRRFSQLRDRYRGCTSRIESGEWMTLVEVIGAGAIYTHVDQLQGDQVDRSLRRATAIMVRNFPEKSATEVCSEAMPMPDFYHQCVDAVQRAMRINRQADHAQRNQRVEQVRHQFSEGYPVLEARPACANRR